MIDKSIPHYRIIMKYYGDISSFTEPVLPQGFRFKGYESGDREKWADIECSVGEFETTDKAAEYFDKEFMPHEELLKDRCLFIIDGQGNYAGTSSAWFFDKEGPRMGMVHWVAVKPEYQGLGLGKALVQKIMSLFPIYEPGCGIFLHTQTWSHKAVVLYSRLGFRMMKKESFGGRTNDYYNAIEVLKGCVDNNSYERLVNEAI